MQKIKLALTFSTLMTAIVLVGCGGKTREQMNTQAHNDPHPYQTLLSLYGTLNDSGPFADTRILERDIDIYIREAADRDFENIKFALCYGGGDHDLSRRMREVLGRGACSNITVQDAEDLLSDAQVDAQNQDLREPTHSDLVRVIKKYGGKYNGGFWEFPAVKNKQQFEVEFQSQAFKK
jgi:hypothetical protein